MTRPANPRTNSQGRSLVKASRPSALKLSKAPHGLKTSPPSNKSRGKRSSRSDADDDWSDVMAALPNFCTTCEKQIINPNGTYLYCSESKDASRPASTAMETGVPSPPMIPGTESEEDLFADIVPQCSPTVLRPASIISTDSIGDGCDADHADSDAAKYLSQFLSTGNASPSRRSRTTYYRNAHRSSQTTLPSLSHTPNSLASPFSSYSSVSRTAPSRMGAWGHRPNSRSLDLGTAASMNRASVLHSKSNAETASRVYEGELTYEKRPMATTPTGSPAASSLKQLFAHEAMRRPSTLSHNKSNSSLSGMADKYAA